MTPKELGELGPSRGRAAPCRSRRLPAAELDAALEPGLRKSVTHLRDFAVAPSRNAAKSIDFDFFARPVAVEGDGAVEGLLVERTRLEADGRAVGTGETYRLPCGLVIPCIGYQTPPIEGVPYDEAGGRFLNRDGVIGGGLYCVGWARRGPSGTIGTNRPDGFEVAEKIAAALGAGATEKAGGAAIDRLLDARGVRPVSFSDWQRIEAAEAARARAGAPREKFVSVADMLGHCPPPPTAAG
jgi:ferredoxin--NADP+ reductase